MSVRHDLRDETVAPTKEQRVRRAPRPVHPPRWLLPAAIGLLVVVAVIVGVSWLRSGDDTTTPAAFEPLIVPEEQEFIDTHTVPVPPRSRSAEPTVVFHVRPSGVPGLLGDAEAGFVLDRVPGALLASPAREGFPQLVDEYEQAFIDGAYHHPFFGLDWCDTHTPC